MRTTLTAFVPAHKQTNPQHAPGQVVNYPEPSPNTATNPVNPLGFVDNTLGDYIRRKDGINKAFEAVKKECCGNPLRTGPNGRGCENCPPPKKMTFDEWFEEEKYWKNAYYDVAKAAWIAAIKHGKIS